jgi:hypothetical protein
MPLINDIRSKSVSDILDKVGQDELCFLYITGGPAEDRGGSYVIRMPHLLDREDLKTDIERRFVGQWADYLLHPRMFPGTIRVAVHIQSGSIFLLDSATPSGVKWWLKEGRGARCKDGRSASSRRLDDLKECVASKIQDGVNIQFLAGSKDDEIPWRKLSSYLSVVESVDRTIEEMGIKSLLLECGFDSLPDIPVYEIDVSPTSRCMIGVEYQSPAMKSVLLPYQSKESSQSFVGLQMSIEGPCIIAYRNSSQDAEEFASLLAKEYISCIPAIAADVRGVGLPWEPKMVDDCERKHQEMVAKYVSSVCGTPWEMRPVKVNSRGEMARNLDARTSKVLSIEENDVTLSCFVPIGTPGAGVRLFDARPSQLEDYLSPLSNRTSVLSEMENLLKENRISAMRGKQGAVYVRTLLLDVFPTVAERIRRCVTCVQKLVSSPLSELRKAAWVDGVPEEIRTSMAQDPDFSDADSFRRWLLGVEKPIVEAKQTSMQDPNNAAAIDKVLMPVRNALEACVKVLDYWKIVDVVCEMPITSLATHLPFPKRAIVYGTPEEATKDLGIEVLTPKGYTGPVAVCEDEILGNRSEIEWDLWDSIKGHFKELHDLFDDSRIPDRLMCRIAHIEGGYCRPENVLDLLHGRWDPIGRNKSACVVKETMVSLERLARTFSHLVDINGLSRYSMEDDFPKEETVKQAKVKTAQFAVDYKSSQGINAWWNTSFPEFGAGAIIGGPSQEGTRDREKRLRDVPLPWQRGQMVPADQKKKKLTEAEFVAQAWEVACRPRRSTETMLGEMRRLPL